MRLRDRAALSIALAVTGQLLLCFFPTQLFDDVVDGTNVPNFWVGSEPQPTEFGLEFLPEWVSISDESEVNENDGGAAGKFLYFGVRERRSQFMREEKRCSGSDILPWMRGFIISRFSLNILKDAVYLPEVLRHLIVVGACRGSDCGIERNAGHSGKDGCGLSGSMPYIHEGYASSGHSRNCCLRESDRTAFLRDKIWSLFELESLFGVFECNLGGIGGAFSGIRSVPNRASLNLDLVVRAARYVGVDGGSNKGEPCSNRKPYLYPVLLFLVFTSLSFYCFWNLQFGSHDWRLLLALLILCFFGIMYGTDKLLDATTEPAQFCEYKVDRVLNWMKEAHNCKK